MKNIYTKRQVRFVVMVAILIFSYALAVNINNLTQFTSNNQNIVSDDKSLAINKLGELAVRERVSSEGYSRERFAPGWESYDGCDVRNRILKRDLDDVKIDSDNDCYVLSGVLDVCPFTGKRIEFVRGPDTSGDIHIEHIVALSDAWQKGAQDLNKEERRLFFNDYLNLIAVDGPANIEKGDKDASDWLPWEPYRCKYIARQIAIKYRYDLWVTESEHDAMKRVLQTCPSQQLPKIGD